MKKPLRWWTAGVDAAAGAVVLALVMALAATWFFAALSAWGTPGPPPARLVIIYWLIAGAVIGLLVLGMTVAIQQRRGAAMVAYPVVAIAVLAAIVTFAVPAWPWEEIKDSIVNPQYEPNPDACRRTDSENCPGG